MRDEELDARETSLGVTNEPAGNKVGDDPDIIEEELRGGLLEKKGEAGGTELGESREGAGDIERDLKVTAGSWTLNRASPVFFSFGGFIA